MSAGEGHRTGIDTKSWSNETRWGGCCPLSPHPPGARQCSKGSRVRLRAGKLLVSQLIAEGSSCCRSPWFCQTFPCGCLGTEKASQSLSRQCGWKAQSSAGMGFPVLCNLRTYGRWWVSPKGHWFKSLQQEEGPIPDVARRDSLPQGYAGILD